MARIFISYRREGAAGFSGRLADDLERRFGPADVFRDVEDIASGEDFVERLTAALRDCRVLLAVIDKSWLSASAAGRRRLDDPDDFVRTEIVRALALGVRVIPVLVNGAAMPADADLPGDLKPFARRQAHELSDSRWDYDLERLAGVVRSALADERSRATSDARPRRRRWPLALAAVAVVVIAAAIWFASSRAPDLDGTWDLPDGSYWVIQQSGRDLAIDVVHASSRQVWQRGRGTIDDHEVTYALELVHQPRDGVNGRLSISRDVRRLTGVAVATPSGHRTELILQRR